MATNVNFASNDSLLESLFLHVAPDFGPHGDGIINNNFLFAKLKEKNRMKIIPGGLEFVNGLLARENSNFKWQSHTTNMTAQLQDPNLRLRFDIMTFTGSIVINKKHEAMVKGRAMIKNWIMEHREQARSTIPNLFNSAFWNTSPVTATEPESIPTLISTTPTTGTIGGLTRSTNAALQNGLFSDTVSDIGSEAGVNALKRAQIRQAISANDMIDVMIMSDDLYAGLVGFLASQNRFRPDDKMAQLDIEAIKLGRTSISFENTNVKGSANTIAENRVYGINSNHMDFKVLRDGNFVWNPDGFERVGLTLNKALYFWVFCNLTTNLPSSHLVMTNVSSG